MKELVGVIIFVMLISGTTSVTGEPLPSCNGIVGELSPCISYLSKAEATPSPPCCAGVRFLSNYADDKADRVSICQCLELSASMFPNVDYSLLPSLTTSCGVDVNLPPINPKFDCSKA